MNLIDTLSIRTSHSPQGRISITIGKIAVELRPDKARPCHTGGTKVTGAARGQWSVVSKKEVY
jgi:hypothetical protein